MKVVLVLAAGLCILSVVQGSFSSGSYYKTGSRGSFDPHHYDDKYHGIGRDDLHTYGPGKSLRLKGLSSILSPYHRGGFKGHGHGKYGNSFYGGNGISLHQLLSYFGVGTAYELMQYYGIDIRKYIDGGHYGGNDYYPSDGGHYYGDDKYYDGDDYYRDSYHGNKYGNKHYGRGKGYHKSGRQGPYHLLGGLRKYLGGGRGHGRYYGGNKHSILY